MSTNFYSYDIYLTCLRANNQIRKDLAKVIFRSPKFKLPKFQLEQAMTLQGKLNQFNEFFKLPFNSAVFEIEMDLSGPKASLIDVDALKAAQDFTNMTVICEYVSNDEAIKDIKHLRTLTNTTDPKAVQLFKDGYEFLSNKQNKLVSLVAFNSSSKKLIFRSLLDLTKISVAGSVMITTISGIVNLSKLDDSLKSRSQITIDLSPNVKYQNKRLELEQELSLYYTIICGPILYNLLWINCKNNRIHTHSPTNKLIKKQSTIVKNAFNYQILDIYNQVNDCKTEENLEKCINLNINRISHMVRGHFKCIKGKLHWWSPHMRNRDKGPFVQKDYNAH